MSEAAGGLALADQVYQWSERLYQHHLPDDCTVVDTVAVGRGPIGGMAVSADGRRLVVSNFGDDSVSVIDTETGAVAHTVFGAGEPFAIGTGTRAGRHAGCAYVGTASAAFDSVLAIDIHAGDVVAAYPVAFSVDDLVVDPAGQRVYVVRTGASGVDAMIIEAGRGPVDAVELSTAPGATATCIRISPDGRRLYAAVHRPDGDTVTVLDPDLNVVDTIEVGSTIRDMAVSPDGDSLLIAGLDSLGAGRLQVVDTRTKAITDGLAVGEPVTQLAVSRDGERAYLVTADSVVVVGTRGHRVVDAIAVAGSPSCVVESPDGSQLYIADYHGAVTVVSVAVASLPAGFLTDDAVRSLLELEPAV